MLSGDAAQANENVRAKLTRMRRAQHSAMRMAERFGTAITRLRTTAKAEAEESIASERRQLSEGLEAVARVTEFAGQLIAHFVPKAAQAREHQTLDDILNKVARTKVQKARRERDEKRRGGDER